MTHMPVLMTSLQFSLQVCDLASLEPHSIVQARVLYAYLVAVACAASVPGLDGEVIAGYDRHPRT